MCSFSWVFLLHPVDKNAQVARENVKEINQVKLV